ncbi:hypothetical protein [Longimicrobium sp.]|uniref:hypothetical protein n=1 Tax=Longimicrobium sp. TaxID=2029185 RepID=UPI002E326DF4|nr:hypothetical protein [Longimicrobium sp.]HEX6042222.1 hypothetical protein [Longimicrobium sp.]
MRKLELKLDELAVESFAVQADEKGRGRGTVQAHAPDTQQFRCTYFCTYNCTGLPC